jgi:hypothetical protein
MDTYGPGADYYYFTPVVTTTDPGWFPQMAKNFLAFFWNHIGSTLVGNSDGTIHHNLSTI